ncbi:MAG: hypothetical protein IPO21_07225 [Bacteroidales bacterium]|nr:hypothetical protein [Bacteroidales bacterium]
MRTSLFILTSFLLFSSCVLKKGNLLLTEKENEIIATQSIKDYMKLFSNPSIVLKAPNSENKTTQADPNSYIYNAIEKELLIAGFDVKDRGLFNEVVGKSKEINYEEIRTLTGTDLILELVNVSTKLEFVTNKYYKADGRESIAPYTYKVYGAVIEFKLIIIQNNQYAGSYLFYYTPCSKITEDCGCKVLYKDFPSKVYPYLNPCTIDMSPNRTSFEYVSQDAMVEFVRNGVKQMINEIKNK